MGRWIEKLGTIVRRWYCSDKLVIIVRKLGRLGNMVSTYLTNHDTCCRCCYNISYASNPQIPHNYFQSHRYRIKQSSMRKKSLSRLGIFFVVRNPSFSYKSFVRSTNTPFNRNASCRQKSFIQSNVCAGKCQEDDHEDDIRMGRTVLTNRQYVLTIRPFGR